MTNIKKCLFKKWFLASFSFFTKKYFERYFSYLLLIHMHVENNDIIIFFVCNFYWFQTANYLGYFMYQRKGDFKPSSGTSWSSLLMNYIFLFIHNNQSYWHNLSWHFQPSLNQRLINTYLVCLGGSILSNLWI